MSDVYKRQGLKWFALAGIAGAGAIAAAVVLLPELVPYAMGLSLIHIWRLRVPSMKHY